MTSQAKHDRHQPRGWFDLFFGLRGWLVIIGFVVLLVLTAVSVAKYVLDARFDRDGVEVQAVISDMYVIYATDEDDSDDYYVTFAYADELGAGYSVKRLVARSFYRKTGLGRSTTIRYLRTAPEKMEYFVGENHEQGRIFQIISLAIGAASLAGLWIVGGRTNSGIRSRRDGEKITGEVVRVVESVDSDGDPTGKGRLHWVDQFGTAGKSLSQSMGVLRRYKKGDQITLYRHRTSGDVWWQGDVGPRRTTRSSLPDAGRR